LNYRAESSEIGSHGGFSRLSFSLVSEIDSLLEVSARIGSEPLLVQAGTGNTSIKLDGVLWIKASGKWLAHATQDEILIPVNLEEARKRIDQNADPAGQCAIAGGKTLGTSVETAMHSVLPYRVVLHVHSVNTIAWAVRMDGSAELESRLEGIDWQWIPYVPSGLPLARAIETAIARAPRATVLVLANHGLVVCADDCAAAEELLREVERRVAIVPRHAPEAEWGLLNRISERSSWRVPQNTALHAIATDSVSRGIVCGGILYPCQAIFLTPRARVFAHPAGADLPLEELRGIDEPFVTIEGAGVLVRQTPNPAESATLAGLAQVLQRIPESAPLQYLREDQVRDLLCADAYHYRELVEDNGTGRLPFQQGQVGQAGSLRRGGNPPIQYS
jgi:rhamnose utilization protein RhaD (predicted bifunctional aldolase and dehydrogenase)